MLTDRRAGSDREVPRQIRQMNGERTNTATEAVAGVGSPPTQQQNPPGPYSPPQSANGANATAPYRFLASRGHGPTDPVLGANPSSEGTDPFCRLPLPTLMPSTRGCTPWRPAADGGYGPARELRKPDPDFPGPPKAHRTPPEPRRSTGTFSVSPDEPIPRTWSFTKKRELFPGLPATSPGSLASPRFRPRSDGHRRSDVATHGPSPSPGSGILTRFPFDGRPAVRYFDSLELPKRPWFVVLAYGSGAFREDFRPRLRTD